MKRSTYLLFVILSVSIFAGSFSFGEGSEGEKIRVACVGDSITYGGGPRDENPKCYPYQLQKILGEDYLVRNFGVSGATLLSKGNKPYIKTSQYKPGHDFDPDIVVIKLGTNDSKPRNWKHKADFVADYLALIDSFAELKSEPRIWICYPVPAYPGRWGISDQIIKDEVIPLVKQVSEKRKVGLIDLYTALSGHKKCFPDTVHPNREGYRLLAEAVAAAITDGDGEQQKSSESND